MKSKLSVGFSFKPVVKRKVSTVPKKASGLVYIVCKQEESGEFFAHINMKNDKHFPDYLVLPFTDKSYELKGKEHVFSILPDEDTGKIVHFVRTRQDSMAFPGLPSQLTPFRNNGVYSGHIMSIDKKHYFEISEYFGPVSVFQYLLNPETMKDEHNSDK